MKKIFLSKNELKELFRKRWYFLLTEAALFGGIIALDLTMKDFLYEFLLSKSGMNYTLISGFLDLTYSENTGAGFGILSGNTLALAIVTAIVISLVLLYLVIYHRDSEYLRIPLVMISAGGIGNLVDRIGLGYVRDFFEFTFVDFAIFNIADVFVTVGAILLIIYLIAALIKEGAKNRKKFEEEQAEKAEDENSDVGESQNADPIETIETMNTFLDGDIPIKTSFKIKEESQSNKTESDKEEK